MDCSLHSVNCSLFERFSRRKNPGLRRPSLPLHSSRPPRCRRCKVCALDNLDSGGAASQADRAPIERAGNANQEVRFPSRLFSEEDAAIEQVGLVRRPSTSVIVNSKVKILRLLEQGSTNYRPAPGMSSAVEGLVSQMGQDAPAVQAKELGQGTWEVFHAPHIVNLSKTLLGTRFEPIRYTFRDDKIVSNVHYKSPLFGHGWLSASGTYRTLDSSKVQIQFDQFWIDQGDDLREEFVERPSKVTGNILSWGKVFRDEGMIDRVVGSVGRAAFFPSFSVFPILYLDDDLAVFKFEPLVSNIAVRHVGLPDQPQG